MKKILIVEDELSLQKLIKYDLEKAGYESQIIDDGDKVFEEVNNNHYDVILLDLMLPNKNGIEICKEIRSINSEVYVILLTAIDDEFTKLDAFEAGADDYITKPFSIREVLARINVGLKRSKTINDELTFKHLKIDIQKREVYLNEKNVKLTYTEFELIKYLIAHQNIVISREDLIEKIWGYDYLGETRTVDVYCHKLRDKLELGEYLKTIRGVGYMLTDSN